MPQEQIFQPSKGPCKIAVFLNSMASRCQSKGKKSWDNRIKAIFTGHEVQILKPSSIQDMHVLVDQCLLENYDCIVSVGGDGTVHTLLQKIAGTSISLFMIPAGTANDLGTELKIFNSFSDLQFQDVWQRQFIREIDLVDINGRVMSTNGGVGLTTLVANRVNQWRVNIPGFKFLMKYFRGHTYPLVTVYTLLKEKIIFHDYEMQVDGKNKKFRSGLILINNQKRFGGDFLIAPETMNQDGQFNVTIFFHSNRFALLWSILKITFGRKPKLDTDIEIFETNALKLLRLDGQREIFFGDGEAFQENTEWFITLSPKKLKVFSL